MPTVWVLDPQMRLFEESLASDTDPSLLRFLGGHQPLYAPLDIDNRVLATTDTYLYMVYTTGAKVPVCLDPLQLNPVATRIILDHFKLEPTTDTPSNDSLKDCPYGCCVFILTNKERVLQNLTIEFLYQQWPLLFANGCPYQLFANELLVAVDAVQRLRRNFYDYNHVLVNYLKEPKQQLASQRHRVEQVYHGAYIYLLYMERWDSLNNPGQLQVFKKIKR